MVNVALNASSLAGIVLAIAGAGLYFMRSFRPALARDQDIFFAALSLLCGGILFFQGWRQDPILQFGQFMLVASTIWFGYEAVRLRGIATEQAKRTTPVVDEDRPVSRVYRAELDDLPPLDERSSRRIRATRDDRSPRDEYYEEMRRRPSLRGSVDPYEEEGDRARRRSSRSDERPAESPAGSYSVWDDGDDVSTARSTRSASSDAPRSRREPGSSRRRRDGSPRRRSQASSSSEYVDYQPINGEERSPSGGWE